MEMEQPPSNRSECIHFLSHVYTKNAQHPPAIILLCEGDGFLRKKKEEEEDEEEEEEEEVDKQKKTSRLLQPLRENRWRLN